MSEDTQDMNEQFFVQQMMTAYHEMVPDASVSGDYFVRRLAGAIYARGARIEIGVEPAGKAERTIHQSLDPDQRICWVSKPWNQVMGYRSRSAIGRHISEILAPHSLGHFLELWPTLLKYGKLPSFGVTLVTAEGAMLPAKGKSEILRDSEGTFLRTFTRIVVTLPRVAAAVIPGSLFLLA